MALELIGAGLGRTGTLWGVEQWGVEADILVTGKGLSGGLYPVSATLLNAKAGERVPHIVNDVVRPRSTASGVDSVVSSGIAGSMSDSDGSIL